MNAVEKHKKFIDWRNDLEYREILYCIEHPEKTALKADITEVDKKKLSDCRNAKIKVEVLESYVKGSWCVWLNDSRMKFFDGKDAHQNATRFAGQLLNSDNPDELI